MFELLSSVSLRFHQINTPKVILFQIASIVSLSKIDPCVYSLRIGKAAGIACMNMSGKDILQGCMTVEVVLCVEMLIRVSKYDET